MSILRRAVVASAFLGILAGTASADILIDDFSSVGTPDPWPVVINTIDTVIVHETGLSNVLGGSRNSVIRATDLDQPGLDFITAAIVPNFGMVLDFSSSAGAEGDWLLLYDGDGGGLNADFSNQTEVAVDFDLFDHSNGEDMPVSVIISDGTNFAALSRSLNQPGARTLHFEFADFVGIEQLDMSSIQSLSVFMEPGGAGDFRLSRVGVIPTPGSIALLAIGSLAFAGGRRRRDILA